MILASPQAASVDLLSATATGRAAFNSVLRKGWFGIARTERAVFVTSREDGTFGCVAWPTHHVEAGEIFNGTMPESTVAIIHTHPLEWPLPSVKDREEADRLGIPIYVVTPRLVTKTMPGESRPVEVARNASWLTGKADDAFRCQE